MLSNNRHTSKAAILGLLSVVLSWLLMQILHESGHVLHAWFSNGTVTKVVLHPLTISRTDVAPNPYPLFVVWGGPIWGCLLPLLLWFTTKQRLSKIEYFLRFLTGFCLIANGAYLGVGSFYPVGDAETLLQLGTPEWLLALFGATTIPAGLWFWNGLGIRFGFGKGGDAIENRTILLLSLLMILLILLELALSESV